MDISEKVITIANQKGDAGKTTTCGNLSIELAREGMMVLLADRMPSPGMLTVNALAAADKVESLGVTENGFHNVKDQGKACYIIASYLSDPEQ